MARACPASRCSRQAPDEPVDLVLGRDVEELVTRGEALPDEGRRDPVEHGRVGLERAQVRPRLERAEVGRRAVRPENHLSNLGRVLRCGTRSFAGISAGLATHLRSSSAESPNSCQR